jgi:hypothetical protein
MKTLLLAAVLALAIAVSLPGDGIEGCTGHASQFPLIDTEPTLVDSVPNGKKYTIGTF